jgi:hypothetical protein
MEVKMRQEVKMQVRLPVEIRDALAADARNNERSMNGQLIAILKERFRLTSLGSEPNEARPPDQQ